MLAISLQERLVNLYKEKNSLLNSKDVDYHKVATCADDIAAVEKEIEQNGVEVMIP